MSTTKSKAKASFSKRVIEPLANNLKAIVTIGSSIAAIIAAFGVGFGWVSQQITSNVNDKIDEVAAQVAAFKESSDAGDDELKRGMTRMELLSMMEHNPNNTAEIERIASYYFCDLNGDWYMSSLFSEWAADYGGDPTIMIECHSRV